MIVLTFTEKSKAIQVDRVENKGVVISVQSKGALKNVQLTGEVNIFHIIEEEAFEIPSLRLTGLKVSSVIGLPAVTKVSTYTGMVDFLANE